MALSFHVNADPTHATLWGDTLSDLRRADVNSSLGEPYVRELMDWVQTERVSERQLMNRIDHDLEHRQVDAGVKIRRFWTMDDRPRTMPK